MDYWHLIAHHDPAHCLAPGLFVALPRGERNHRPLHVIYRFNDQERLEFHGPYQLGPDDLKVLLALVAIGTSNEAQRWLVPSPPETDLGQTVRSRLSLEDDAKEAPVLAVRTTFYQLARAIGWTRNQYSGTLQTHIRECVERLAMVTLIIQHKKQRFSTSIVSKYMSDENDGTILVGLNLRITEAIAHQRAYTLLAMKDIQRLTKDSAVMMLHHLSGWIDIRATRRVRMSTLISYVFETHEALDRRTQWKRRQIIADGLSDLAQIGWDIVPVNSTAAEPTFDITRPSPYESKSITLPTTDQTLTADKRVKPQY